MLDSQLPRDAGLPQSFKVRVRSRSLPDAWIIVPTVVLLCLSFLVVYSATAIVSHDQYGTGLYFITRHTVHVTLGVILAVILARVPLSVLRNIAPALFLVSVLLLLASAIPGIGTKAGGARRWLGPSFVRFQPGELVKLATVIYLASFIGRHQERLGRVVFGCIIPFGIVGLLAVILLSQPDFGTTAIITLVTFGMLLCVARPLPLLGMGLVGMGAAALLIVTSPYRLQRVRAFLDPLADASDSGYQLTQSLIAITAGGVTGMGLGSGRQKLFYLPAAHTDFIFAVIAEELGYLGALAIVFLFLALLVRGLSISLRLAEDPFRYALAIGTTLLLVLPAFLNVGVNLGMLPTKGLVLPLVSYGGTAMVINLGLVGLLLNLSRESER